jgi:hypothetical protein
VESDPEASVNFPTGRQLYRRSKHLSGIPLPAFPASFCVFPAGWISKQMSKGLALGAKKIANRPRLNAIRSNFTPSHA